MKIITGILVLVIMSTLLWAGIRIYKSYSLDINCIQHLKRAADANTIDIAKVELKTSLNYLKNHKLTSGTVSIFISEPENDIGFWYRNIKASLVELESIKSDASILEKTNLLMKLRETLIDSGEKITVTCPNGMSIYPNNMIYFLWSILNLILLLVFSISLLYLRL